MTQAKIVDQLGEGLLQELAAMNGIHLGPCGRRVRMRRWLNMTVTPIRFPEQGGIGWRAPLFLGCLMFGYLALRLEELSPKITAVLHADLCAGLDLRVMAVEDEPTWKITNFWAWPIGHGRGSDVLAAVLAAADATGTTLVLSAANRRLADRYYVPVGFVVRPGQERSKRPWIERRPVVLSEATLPVAVYG